MKLGGLFSGIGGFELAWTRLGGEVAWMCEIDTSARKVLEERFPGVPIYDDIRELDTDVCEQVDVVTGGSPCQGFSTSGQRMGLLHGESRLFAEYVRVIDDLSHRGLRWALWENVPGVLSNENDDGEKTFEHVVAALAGSTFPVRLDRERIWNTGMAVGRDRAVSWRVLDSRHFGVAQRRRRVYACVAFGDSAGDRAGRGLLALPDGMQGRVGAGRTTEFAVAGTTAGSVEDSGRPLAFDWQMGHTARTKASYEVVPALSATKTQAVMQNGKVRKIAPVEAERLQGFPDGWTEPAGSFRSRHKALGNAVTVNTVQWILRRMIHAG